MQVVGRDIRGGRLRVDLHLGPMRRDTPDESVYDR